MIARTTAVLARVTLTPLLTRTGVGLAAVAGLLLSVPPQLYVPPVLAGVLLLACAPAVAPGRIWPTLVIVATALLWLVSTELYHQPVSLLRVLLLSGLLYLLHALAALAAALPYDAVVAPDLLPWWWLRALAVVAGSSLLSAAVLAGLTVVMDRAGNRAHVLATLAGLVLALALAAALAHRLRAAHAGRS